MQQTRQDLPSTSNPLRRNAFELMMYAQAEKASVVLPRKVQMHNKKDELFSDICSLLKRRNLFGKEVRWIMVRTASNAISTLRDALRYIDGHHQTLADRSCHVSHVFTGFVEYNSPE